MHHAIASHKNFWSQIHRPDLIKMQNIVGLLLILIQQLFYSAWLKTRNNATVVGYKTQFLSMLNCTPTRVLTSLLFRRYKYVLTQSVTSELTDTLLTLDTNINSAAHFVLSPGGWFGLPKIGPSGHGCVWLIALPWISALQLYPYSWDQWTTTKYWSIFALSLRRL